MELAFAAVLLGALFVGACLVAAAVVFFLLAKSIGASRADERRPEQVPPRAVKQEEPPRDPQRLAGLLETQAKFLAFAAHDMRTPLGTIEGFSHLLARAPEPRRADYLAHIDRAVGSLRRLLGDLTDLGAIESGRFRVDFGTFDAGRMVREVADGLLPACREKGIRLSTLSVEQGAIVHADRFRLAQALQNLLANALKFTPEGGRVDVGARVRDGRLEVSVEDNGRGVDPREAPFLFDKFYQAKGLEGAERSGLGLGLTIARDIVRAHGGDIGVESRGLGKGSRFYFRVPAERPRAGASMLRWGVLLLLAAVPAGTQTLPLAERTAFEKTLETKSEDVLESMLGPGQAKVVVDAALDFDRTETIDIRMSKPSAAPSKPKPKPAPLPVFRPKPKPKKPEAKEKDVTFPGLEFPADVEDSEGQPTQPSDDSLPGLEAPGGASNYAAKKEAPSDEEAFPDEIPLESVPSDLSLPGLPGEPEAEAKEPSVPRISGPARVVGYDKHIVYPPLYLKRLAVTVVLNDAIPIPKAEAVRDVLTKVLELSIARGDSLRLVRAPFARKWGPSFGDEGQWILRLLTILLLVAAGAAVVSVFFWRLTNVVSELAKAALPPPRPSELPRYETPRLAVRPAPAVARPAPEDLEETEEDDLDIEVDAVQAAALSQLLTKEDSQNIALVASRLRGEARAALLDGLPPELAARVVVEMSKPRYVDPEAQARLKDEVERRLKGMVGGPDRALETVERLSESAKKALIEHLSLVDPELAASLRRRALLLEDLLRLPEGDWDLLAASVETEDWAAALQGAPPELADQLQVHMPPDAWEAVARTRAGRLADPAEASRARERVVRSAWRLIRERRMANPIPEDAY